MIVADIESLVYPLSLESRIAGSVSEEVPERRLKVKKRLLRRILRDFINEWKLLALDCVELFLERHSRGFAARFVFLAPSLEGPIPNEASDTAGAPQVDLLLRSRVQAYFVAECGRQSPV